MIYLKLLTTKFVLICCIADLNFFGFQFGLD